MLYNLQKRLLGKSRMGVFRAAFEGVHILKNTNTLTPKPCPLQHEQSLSGAIIASHSHDTLVVDIEHLIQSIRRACKITRLSGISFPTCQAGATLNPKQQTCQVGFARLPWKLAKICMWDFLFRV